MWGDVEVGNGEDQLVFNEICDGAAPRVDDHVENIKERQSKTPFDANKKSTLIPSNTMRESKNAVSTI